MNQQIQKYTEFRSKVQEILNGPALKPISWRYLVQLTKKIQNSRYQQIFVQIVSEALNYEKSVTNRLKLWVLIHLVLSGEVKIKTVKRIEILIEKHEIQIKTESKQRQTKQLIKYFLNEVELTYVIFLKKLLNWKANTVPSHSRDIIINGLIQLNRIKQILQLKRFFHHLACYYPHHEYILNVFEYCLINLREFWISVCYKIKAITIQAIRKNQIEKIQYNFIEEAEVVQDLIIEFVYGSHFVQSIKKSFQIKAVCLLSPKMVILGERRKRQSALRAVMTKVQQKQNRRNQGLFLSIQSKKMQKCQKETQIDTQQQGQLVNSIRQLQEILSYEH